MKLTIGKRIAVGFSVIVALVIVLGVFGIAQLQTLGGFVESLGTGSLPGVSQTLRLQYCSSLNLSRIYRHIGSEDPKAM